MRNNVSIDAYCAAEVSRAPVVINVPAQRAPRWTIVQIGDCCDRVVSNIAGSIGPLVLIAGSIGPLVLIAGDASAHRDNIAVLVSHTRGDVRA